MDTAKTQKSKIQKGTFFQLAQLCSQTVLLIFGVGLKNKFLAENTIKQWFQHILEKLPKNGPRLSQKLVQG